MNKRMTKAHWDALFTCIARGLSDLEYDDADEHELARQAFLMLWDRRNGKDTAYITYELGRDN